MYWYVIIPLVIISQCNSPTGKERNMYEDFLPKLCYQGVYGNLGA